MANQVKWSSYAAALASGLTTELNSLANGSYSAVGSEIDNAASGAHHMYADFELGVTYGSAPSAGGYVALFLVQAIDGTNYQDGGGSVAPPATAWVGNFPLRQVTTAQRVALRHVLLPNSKFKLVAQNNAGQAMAASGNTLGYRAYNEEVQ
jgi:hypothetical protein